MDTNRIKGCYMHSLNCMPGAEDKSYGVLKKINAQFKVLERHFQFDHIINYYQTRNTIFEKIRSRLPFTHISEKWKYKKTYLEYDFIYFRKNIIDYSILFFFRQIKKYSPGTKIILEIPTFPYDGEEFNSFKDLPFKLKDRINRKRLHKYVDLITTYGSNKTTIFNIPCLTLMNGIDFSMIPVKTSEFHENRIDIFIVGLFSHWHGYERLLYGLNNYIRYQGDVLFHLHFVGDGISLPLYKKIVVDNSLDKYVTFYGSLSGKELDDVADLCDIGCDTLGFHRKNVHISSTLKTRDYAARGLPIIGSELIDFIDDDFKYFLKLDANDNLVDFEKIIKFYEKLEKKNLATNIREYSIKKIDMENVLKPLVNYIKNEKE